MEKQLIRRNGLTAKQWSGGTTTELFVYPQGTSYASQDFGFRISTSTVDQEHSVFTVLPDVYRKIMVLEGEMELNHGGAEAVVLNRSEEYGFDGSLQTESHGRCRDFNLMLRRPYSGMIHEMDLNKGMSVHLAEMDFAGLYLLRGSIEYGEMTVSEGDFLFLMKSSACESVNFRVLSNTRIILAKIKQL